MYATESTLQTNQIMFNGTFDDYLITNYDDCFTSVFKNGTCDLDCSLIQTIFILAMCHGASNSGTLLNVKRGEWTRVLIVNNIIALLVGRCCRQGELSTVILHFGLGSFITKQCVN